MHFHTIVELTVVSSKKLIHPIYFPQNVDFTYFDFTVYQNNGSGK